MYYHYVYLLHEHTSKSSNREKKVVCKKTNLDDWQHTTAPSDDSVHHKRKGEEFQSWSGGLLGEAVLQL